MTKKFTPGPWKINKTDLSKPILIIHSGWKRVATIKMKSPYCQTEEEMKANANLIASSPELLEALEVLVIQNKAASKEDYAKAKAAIAKAKGESEVSNG